MKYLIESALLVHGIKNLDEQTILHYWDSADGQIVWMEAGEIVTGGIDRLLDFRGRMRANGQIPRRANHFNIDKYAEIGADCVMTASGAMSVCAREGIPAAVTAGIGGFFPEILEEAEGILWTRGDGPPDVATLTGLNVVLVASGPKDMLDCPGTIRFLDEHGVHTYGASRNVYTGYLFVGEETCLSPLAGEGSAPGADCDSVRMKALSDAARGRDASVLVINEIAEGKRMSDRRILDEAVEFALEEEKKGGYYHPAVNAKIEELTGGYSARLQLAALAANARLAQKL
ncbi:MAG: pseudouridine-5'-phosphate glycosidase [Lachnospiraceae bacterium]|nr:pseudouridine-5'-phosphate glycosidase [Lachnospiraceae bacterium]